MKEVWIMAITFIKLLLTPSCWRAKLNPAGSEAVQGAGLQARALHVCGEIRVVETLAWPGRGWTVRISEPASACRERTAARTAFGRFRRRGAAACRLLGVRFCGWLLRILGIASGVWERDGGGEMSVWYYGENGLEHGPVSEAELDELIASQRVTPASLVWREGMHSWLPLSAARGHQAMSMAGPSAAMTVPGSGAFPPYPSHEINVPSSGLAVASLVCGIVGIATCTFITGIPAVICGHMAMSEIANSPVPMAGRGMAITGLITGYLAILPILTGIGFLFFFVFLQAF